MERGDQDGSVSHVLHSIVLKALKERQEKQQ